VITYIRNGKNMLHSSYERERNEKNVRETTLQTTRSVKKKGEEVFQALE